MVPDLLINQQSINMTNGTMIQYFHWYLPNDGGHWDKLVNDIGKLKELGINAAWLPPAYKDSSQGQFCGYDTYDIFDLGEFDQKGQVRTKYGTKEQYLHAVRKAREAGIKVYVDVVLNHKAGADETEVCKVVKVNPDNRNEVISEPFDAEIFTKFTFPGRGDTYSSFKWDFHSFTGVDYALQPQEGGIFMIQNEWGDGWDNVVAKELGNYDYLMFNDIEFRNPMVTEELKHWGRWYYETVNFDGVRLDAVKHIAPHFFIEWLDHMREVAQHELFAVGELWTSDVQLLLEYIEQTEGRMHLFDAALQNKFHHASKIGNSFNMATIFDNTLVQANPTLAVTLLDNHDTQPLQALEAPIEDWFKPLAYALILLREAGYPCVFYPDLFGAQYTDKGRDGKEYGITLNTCYDLESLLRARNLFAYGFQRDYFDHPNCIGWTREGIDEKENSGLAVLMSNSEEGFKEMEIGQKHAGKTFINILDPEQEVFIAENGCAIFHVAGGNVAVYIIKQ
jgi:alpha-amylase